METMEDDIKTINTDGYLRVEIPDKNIIHLEYNLTNIRLLFQAMYFESKYRDGVNMSCSVTNTTQCLIMKIDVPGWDEKFSLQREVEKVEEDDLIYFLENIDDIIPCTHREGLSDGLHPLLQVYHAVLDK